MTSFIPALLNCSHKLNLGNHVCVHGCPRLCPVLLTLTVTFLPRGNLANWRHLILATDL